MNVLKIVHNVIHYNIADIQRYIEQITCSIEI